METVSGSKAKDLDIKDTMGRAKGFLRSVIEGETKNLIRFLFLGTGCLILLFFLCIGSYFFIRQLTKETVKDIKSGLPFSTDNKTDEDRFKKPKVVGATVIAGKVQWIVEEAKAVHGLEDTTGEKRENCVAGSGNKLIYIKAKIKNLDRAFVTVPLSVIDIFDSDKKAYSVSSNKTFNCTGDKDYSLKDKYVPEVLELDEEKSFELVYEVPKETKDLRLKAGDLSTVGKDFEYIDLEI